MTDPAYNVTKLFTVRYFFRKIDCQDRALFVTGGHLGLNCSESSLGTTTSSPRRSPLLWREKPPGDKVVMEMSAGGGGGLGEGKKNAINPDARSSVVPYVLYLKVPGGLFISNTFGEGGSIEMVAYLRGGTLFNSAKTMISGLHKNYNTKWKSLSTRSHTAEGQKPIRTSS